MSILRFLLTFSLYAGGIALVAIGLQRWLAPLEILAKNFWLLFVFLFILTFVVYLLAVLGMRKGGEYGVFSILGGIVIKLLSALSLFLVILLKSSENQLVLGLNFFSIYLLFTAFEVIVLLRKLRHQNKM